MQSIGTVFSQQIKLAQRLRHSIDISLHTVHIYVCQVQLYVYNYITVR